MNINLQRNILFDYTKFATIYFAGIIELDEITSSHMVSIAQIHAAIIKASPKLLKLSIQSMLKIFKAHERHIFTIKSYFRSLANEFGLKYLDFIDNHVLEEYLVFKFNAGSSFCILCDVETMEEFQEIFLSRFMEYYLVQDDEESIQKIIETYGVDQVLKKSFVRSFVKCYNSAVSKESQAKQLSLLKRIMTVAIWNKLSDRYFPDIFAELLGKLNGDINLLEISDCSYRLQSNFICVLEALQELTGHVIDQTYMNTYRIWKTIFFMVQYYR